MTIIRRKVSGAVKQGTWSYHLLFLECGHTVRQKKFTLNAPKTSRCALCEELAKEAEPK